MPAVEALPQVRPRRVALGPAVRADQRLALARAAKRAGVSRFVFASSCSMYGASAGDEALDESAALRPLTPYAESKGLELELADALTEEAFEDNPKPARALVAELRDS